MYTTITDLNSIFEFIIIYKFFFYKTIVVFSFYVSLNIIAGTSQNVINKVRQFKSKGSVFQLWFLKLNVIYSKIFGKI
jgi:hypothetical protein